MSFYDRVCIERVNWLKDTTKQMRAVFDAHFPDLSMHLRGLRYLINPEGVAYVMPPSFKVGNNYLTPVLLPAEATAALLTAFRESQGLL